LNSWHINEYESAAMWKLYLESDEGIAIQSTLGRLNKSLKDTKETIFIGKIKYIDYEKESIPESNQYYPFLYKRKSFEYEKELRLFLKTPSHVISGDGTCLAAQLQPEHLQTIESLLRPSGQHSHEPFVNRCPFAVAQSPYDLS
jgi:hypothetical protein